MDAYRSEVAESGEATRPGRHHVTRLSEGDLRITKNVWKDHLAGGVARCRSLMRVDDWQAGLLHFENSSQVPLNKSAPGLERDFRQRVLEYL